MKINNTIVYKNIIWNVMQIVKNRNVTPLIYNHILFKEGGQEQFLNELAGVYNKFGLDSRLNIHDFLLAEMTFNFLATINNTLNADMELKKDSERSEPETISEIVPHPEKFNPKTQPCVLTNHGIVTDIIKFD